MGYMKEFGRAGQKRTGGIFYEEFLAELQGKKGIETYREMADNDDVVGAILFAIDMLIRGCSWDTQPGGNTPADEEAADFVWQCMNDMTETWIDTISEILSMLTYGWSAHEIIYKHRMGRKKDIRLNSKYNDGRIGWQKLPIRSQETLYRWEYDDNDNLLGLTQMPPPKFDLTQFLQINYCYSARKVAKETQRGEVYCVIRTVLGTLKSEYKKLRV